MTYQRILLAVDFGEESEQLCKRAHEVAEHYSARLQMIHVVEPIVPMPPYELPGVIPADLEQQMQDHARSELTKLADKFQLGGDAVIIETGSTRSMIIDVAKQKQIDLIVVGSHGRHGVGLLLGSTANAVLHHAHCDVLAVRLGGK